ncbi:unnamed protein product [Rangifer tarandus platyrhynchus]|uniref:Uncharacterized protein n=2 Tax=Rangifer tarandus platyrhynchus TaxID=3082113 RepID=A0ABN8XVE1_RANTA|nr:unnamed protein product [Rangifer tarandus platyrhynchus]
MSSSYYPVAFCFNLKDFSISFREDLLVIQSLSFCLFENVLSSPLFLKVLPDIEFLIEFFFLLVLLSMSSHFLLDSMASGERLAIDLIVEPLYMISCCPLASFYNCFFVF